MHQKNKWALSKCMAICSKAEKCISDIQKKLDAWEIDSSDAQEIIDSLVEEKFIDEERFTRYYVKDKFRFNKWGKQKIMFMLKGKRIPDRLIKSSLSEIDPDEYLGMLVELLKAKAPKISFKDEYDRKGKLIRFAQGRGFEYEIIQQALRVLPLL